MDCRLLQGEITLLELVAYCRLAGLSGRHVSSNGLTSTLCERRLSLPDQPSPDRELATLASPQPYILFILRDINSEDS
jgi:hypothetical protein